jgi:hypothetical protein
VYFLNFESEADAPENTLHYNTCKPRPERASDAYSCHGHGMSDSPRVLVRVSETPSAGQAQVSHCQWFTYLDSESVQRICRHILELPSNIIIAGPGTAGVTGTTARLILNLKTTTELKWTRISLAEALIRREPKGWARDTRQRRNKAARHCAPAPGRADAAAGGWLRRENDKKMHKFQEHHYIKQSIHPCNNKIFQALLNEFLNDIMHLMYVNYLHYAINVCTLCINSLPFWRDRLHEETDYTKRQDEKF